MGGSGFAWIANSLAMKELGMIARTSHADNPEETYGVLQTGTIGFLETDGDYKVRNPISDYEEVITLAAQFYMSKGFLTNGSHVINGRDAHTYFTSGPETPTLP
jgi:hypothetical protein